MGVIRTRYEQKRSDETPFVSKLGTAREGRRYLGFTLRRRGLLIDVLVFNDGSWAYRLVVSKSTRKILVKVDVKRC